MKVFLWLECPERGMSDTQGRRDLDDVVRRGVLDWLQGFSGCLVDGATLGASSKGQIDLERKMGDTTEGCCSEVSTMRLWALRRR